MGKILEAAESVEVRRRKTVCGLQAYLDGLDEEELADMEEIFRRANEIKVGDGRYAYVGDVVIAAGGPRLERHGISRHMKGTDGCQRS